jgi:AraC-like DNA-binding protein
MLGVRRFGLAQCMVPGVPALWDRSVVATWGVRVWWGLGPAPRYPRLVTSEELANLAHLRRARDLIDREYARPLEVAELARAALMSTAHFSRQFRAAYGETPYAYLMTRRIERAKALLRRGDFSVTEVCLEVGCTSLGSFSARFTELVGETPTAYRARDHSALQSVPGCLAKDVTRPSRKSSRIGETGGALAA